MLFRSHLPGITVPVTEMVLVSPSPDRDFQISVRAMNSSQIDTLIALGFVHNSIIGYVSPSAKNLGCALTIRLCWDDLTSPTDSLFTLQNCKSGWMEMGVAYTLCSCSNDCCTKLNGKTAKICFSVLKQWKVLLKYFKLIIRNFLIRTSILVD